MRKYNLPRGYSLLQSYWRSFHIVKDPIGSMEESMQQFGGTYSVNLGNFRLIATQDPGFIEHVMRVNHKGYSKSHIVTQRLGRFLGNGLLTSNGEYWLRQRRLIQPGFHAEKIKSLNAIIRDTVDKFLSTFPVGPQVDIYPLMNSLAFEIVINTLFNIDMPVQTRKVLASFINEVQEFVIRDVRQPHKSWWHWVSGEVASNLRKAKRARKTISDIIGTRKASQLKYDDLLDMLLDARYEDNGEPMHEEQIIDEILILLIAGHETTANALSWSLYLLASHPDVLKKLKEDTIHLTLDECVRNEGLAEVIQESMRLYPPAWSSDRVAIQDDTYGSYTFPKKTIVLLFFYGLHRDPKYWDEPNSFKPGRFSSTQLDKDKPKAFYPFGAGPRFCIGSNFAMAEMAIALQALINQFDWKPTGIEPHLRPLITLRPDRVLLQVSRIK